MPLLAKQYFDSGTYEIYLEGTEDLDVTSYVYTRFGTFKIVPNPLNNDVFNALVMYQVFLENTLLGEVYMSGNTDVFEQEVAYALSQAIDVVTTKLNELLDEEERAVLSNIVNEIIDGVNISEEQKAMYRTFLIEQGKLDDVEDEILNPTDILGDSDE